MVKEIQRHTSSDHYIINKRYLGRNIITGFVIFSILAVIAILYKMPNLSYHTYNVVSSVPNRGDACGYICYRDGMIKYSNNGAVAYGREGKILWNGSYEMSEPVVDVCDKYAVISDRKGKQLYIFNENGRAGIVTTLYNIKNVEIASQGVVAVQMYDNDNNYVQFYYEDGTIVSDSIQDTMLVDMKKNYMDYGNLMDIALSKDGKKLVVDFLSVTTGKIISNIGFYNYGEIGQNEVDNFMGGLPYEDIIIPTITFLNNDVVCAFKDNGFVIYAMPEVPKLIKEITLEHKIQSVFYNEKYIGIILMKEGSAPQQLLLYDLKGRKILDQKLDFEYDKIILSGNEIIMYNNTTCMIIKSNGKEKFKYTFDSNLEAFYSSNHSNKYMLITASEISEIVLAK
ncbi:MAG: DUF5711 family protein [Mobilitalea sp.]